MKKRYLIFLLSLLVYGIYTYIKPSLPATSLAPSPTEKVTPTSAGLPGSSRQVLGETIHTNTQKVVRVIDGDTIELENGQKVRYIGIDTPETKKPRTPVQCFGQEAYQKNKELIEGREVLLEKDVSETDRYG